LQDVRSELQRLVELRLLLLELSERISLKLLKVSTLSETGISQVSVVCLVSLSLTTSDVMTLLWGRNVYVVLLSLLYCRRT